MNLGLFTPDSDQPLDPEEQKSTWRWATVTSLGPLRVRLDQTPDPLDSDPVNLVGPLAVGDRVWCQLVNRRIVVVGRGGGGGGVEPGPRRSLASYLTWGTVANEFTIRSIGNIREVRGAITGSLPSGTTTISSAIPSADRPSLNSFSYCYLGGGHPGAFLVRPAGTIALINQSGAARSGDHQFTLIYSVG